MNNNAAEILTYKPQSGKNGIRVRHQDDTLWLTQKRMAKLFGVKVPTINEHLKNIFSEGELEKKSVIRKFRITATDGKKYNTQFYNLDAVISVGYRADSKRATKFRRWARKTLLTYSQAKRKEEDKDYSCLRLKEISHIDKFTLPENTDGSFQFDYISLSDVKNGKISDKLPRYKFSESPSRARKKINSKDILMASVRPNLEGFAQVKYKDTSDKIASTGFSVISPKNDYSSDYIYQYLFSHHIRSQLYALVVGSNYPAITAKDVNNLKIYIPNKLKEQNTIASLLETWDTAIEKTERLIAAKEKNFKWLLKQIMKNQICKEIKKLSEICHCYQPKTISKSNIFEEGKHKVYGANGIIGYYNYYNHEDEQVALTCRGATCGCINFTDKKSWITGNAMVIKPLHSNLDKKFLYYFLLKANFNSFITGMAQPQITRSVIEKMEITFPPLSEQQIIAYKLNTARREINLLQNLAEKYRTQKRGLMQKLLTQDMKGEH